MLSRMTSHYLPYPVTTYLVPRCAVETGIVRSGLGQGDIEATFPPKAIIVVLITIPLVMHARLDVVLRAVVVAHALVNLCNSGVAKSAGEHKLRHGFTKRNGKSSAPFANGI